MWEPLFSVPFSAQWRVLDFRAKYGWWKFEIVRVMIFLNYGG